MRDILPLFTSHYSLTSSLLTLDEAGKAKPDGPQSVFDLAQSVGLKEVVLIDSKIDGFVQAYKSAEKAKVKLVYGLKLCICADMSIKDDPSLKTESKVIVLIRNTAGYSDLIRLWNRAATDGFYYQARLDWATLKSFWTPNLILALPFFSSFLAVNTLTFNRIVPDFPVAPVVFREIGSELPFAHLIDRAIDSYVAEAGIAAEDVVETKTVLYKSRSDFPAFQTLRCIGERTSFEKPNIDHLSSDAFCLESWKELTA